MKKKEFTPEEIKKGLFACSWKGEGCDECPYAGFVLNCAQRITGDALELIEKLEKEADGEGRE